MYNELIIEVLSADSAEINATVRAFVELAAEAAQHAQDSDSISAE